MTRRGIKTAAMIALLCASALSAAGAQAGCAEGRVTVVGDFGAARFTVDVADDAQERARGLMFVEAMPVLSGMLFVYERPQPAGFWMENTLIPLDMLFAEADGTISHIHHNAIPGDRTTIHGGDTVQYVLEINGGLAARLGLHTGAVLQHPAIGPDAALPCDAVLDNATGENGG